VGDLVIIMAFTWLADSEADNFSRKIVKVDGENHPRE
jgi:aspartate 1-decarboxylase